MNQELFETINLDATSIIHTANQIKEFNLSYQDFLEI